MHIDLRSNNWGHTINSKFKLNKLHLHSNVIWILCNFSQYIKIWAHFYVKIVSMCIIRITTNLYLLFYFFSYHLYTFGRSKFMHNGKTFFFQICPKMWNFGLFWRTNFLQTIFCKTIAWQVPYILIWATFVILQQTNCTQNSDIYKTYGYVFIFKIWALLRIFKNIQVSDSDSAHPNYVSTSVKTLLLFFASTIHNIWKST